MCGVIVSLKSINPAWKETSCSKFLLCNFDSLNEYIVFGEYSLETFGVLRRIFQESTFFIFATRLFKTPEIKFPSCV